jgi:hypothetical protein
MRDPLKELARISEIPGSNPDKWLSSAKDSIEFLQKAVGSDPVILYASMPCVLFHAVLAPLKNLDPPDADDLGRDFVNLDDSWMIEHESGGGQPDRVYLSPPLGRHGKSLTGGEKLVFQRSFSGSLRQHPIEISQKLVHTLGLHFIEERSAYCRLDADGDLEDVISIYERIDSGNREDVTVVTIAAKELSEYMTLSEMGMVVFFDFTRLDRSTFNFWKNERHFEHKAKDLMFHGGVMEGHASYVSGRLIARSQMTYEDIVRTHQELRNPSNQEYATFKAINLKTKERMEVSCNPDGLSNYFQPDSPLPLEMSPAFFKAEVLQRYKANPEKYELHDRRIYCRGTWSLRTYDINDAGQVHTYLRYLAYLPYREQLYWQSFNEWPKSWLSERAITTDFKGDFYSGDDPLNALKHKIRELDATPPAWWSPRGEALANTVHYPATAASAEWANEILALDQFLIEGFQLRGLRVLAKGFSRTLLPEWQSLKVLEECLLGSGMEEDEAKATMGSLRKLHQLRSVVKGHATGSKRSDMEKQTLMAHGTFRAHFTSLAADCDATMEIVMRRLRADKGT